MDEHYEWDVRCADLELHRLQDGFGTEDFLAMAGVVTAAYLLVQSDVHVVTDSLRQSGKLEISPSHDGDFEAEISFGGASGGVKNPVRYAASEFFGRSPKHGGPPSHTFFKEIGWTPPRFGSFSGAAPIEDDMVLPVEAFFDRGHSTPHPERGGL